MCNRMNDYKGKSGNDILQMAIDANSFKEMREHLSAIASKQSLDKSRLPELVDTAIRIGSLKSSIQHTDDASDDKQGQSEETFWPRTLIDPVDRSGRPITAIPDLRKISPLGMVGYKVGHTEGLIEYDRREI